MNILVLGSGRVGAAIVRDLAREGGFAVRLADRDASVVRRLGSEADVDAVVADLSSSARVSELAAGADLVVGAVPGHMGLATARAVLEAGRPLVDISFFPEDAFELDEVARAAGVPALVDCGVAPGLSNLVLGHLEATLERVDAFRCLVGGLPVERRWPWEYKAPFSPADVIEEYTRPARLRVGGREVVRPALSEVESVELAGLGTLEAFNTDGLRTLLRTSTVPDLVEKTLRYPGHAERMRALREAGFLSTDRIDVDGVEVTPRALTERLLFDAWRLDEGESELTVMRIEVDGVDGGQPVRHIYTLLDRTDPETGTSSMARTTGYTCTAMVGLVASGLWSEPGVAPPEVIGRRPGAFDAVLAHLEARGVRLGRRVERDG
jgi:saccharopine dehydrogenase-like NADP-dependent oxidoreductase